MLAKEFDVIKWTTKTNSSLNFIITDDHGDEESMTVLGELEKIDDDCDRHGIQFVKIDDKKAAKEFGIDDVPSIVYFEKQIPNVYDGKFSLILQLTDLI